MRCCAPCLWDATVVLLGLHDLQRVISQVVEDCHSAHTVIFYRRLCNRLLEEAKEPQHLWNAAAKMRQRGELNSHKLNCAGQDRIVESGPREERDTLQLRVGALVFLAAGGAAGRRETRHTNSVDCSGITRQAVHVPCRSAPPTWVAANPCQTASVWRGWRCRSPLG